MSDSTQGPVKSHGKEIQSWKITWEAHSPTMNNYEQGPVESLSKASGWRQSDMREVSWRSAQTFPITEWN